MRTQFALGAQLYRTGREGQVVMTARRNTAQRGDSLRLRRTWYAGEFFSGDGSATPVPGQTPAPATGQTPAQGQQPAAPATPATPTPEPDKGKDKDEVIPDWAKDPAKAYEEIRKLRSENATHRQTAREAQAEKERLEADKAKADEKKLADEKEFEKLAQKATKERDDALAELARERLSGLKLRIGTEFKLPGKLIERLQGATEEDLRKDAEALVKDLGLDKQTETPATPNQPADPARRQTTTTVAPGGQTVGETDAEHLARLKQPYQKSPLFEPPGG